MIFHSCSCSVQYSVELKESLQVEIEKRIILQLDDVKMWNIAFAQRIEVVYYITKEPNKKKMISKL